MNLIIQYNHQTCKEFIECLAQCQNNRDSKPLHFKPHFCIIKLWPCLFLVITAEVGIQTWCFKALTVFYPGGGQWQRAGLCDTCFDGGLRYCLGYFSEMWAAVFEVRSTEGKWPNRLLVRWLPVCWGLERADVAGVRARGHRRAVTTTTGVEWKIFWCRATLSRLNVNSR